MKRPVHVTTHAAIRVKVRYPQFRGYWTPAAREILEEAAADSVEIGKDRTVANAGFLRGIAIVWDQPVPVFMVYRQDDKGVFHIVTVISEEDMQTNMVCDPPYGRPKAMKASA